MVQDLTPDEILADERNLVCTCPEKDCRFRGRCKECIALHRYYGMSPNCLTQAMETSDGMAVGEA